MNQSMNLLRAFWCRLMHHPRYLTRPVRGRYRCFLCLTEFSCSWDAKDQPSSLPPSGLVDGAVAGGRPVTAPLS